MPDAGAPPPDSELTRRARRDLLVALIAAQVALHAVMTGVRLAAPLLALRDGASAWVVGALVAVVAALPVVTSIAVGRLADRRGYHKPIRVAVFCSMTGALCALVGSVWAGGRLPLLFVACALCGAAANAGVIAITRTAGRHAHDATEQKQVFSWLALAPALANIVGPVLAGLLIDAVGYPPTFAVLALLPIVTLVLGRRVPREVPPQPVRVGARPHAFDLFRSRLFARLMLVNWLLAASWDLHGFLVPILGHERGFSASAIGFILGVFAAAVSAVRIAIPLLAHRLDESRVLVAAMWVCAGVLVCYPLARQVPLMAVFAAILGVALGAVQPMVMTTLHQITPAHRHGEAIALRSMTINFSSTLMPLGFGVVGTALGPAALFWVMGAAVGAGSMAARGIGRRREGLPPHAGDG